MDNKEFIKLSIIIPTIGRIQELDNLLLSIFDADLPFEYEIIIVDQNPTGFLDSIIKKFEGLKHYNVSFKGLSKAKNFGFECSTGRYVCFPDDDCLVLKDTFTIGMHLIEWEGLNMVAGKCVDIFGNDSVQRFKKDSYRLNFKNMRGGFVEATIISERKILEMYKFDENMGAGAFYGAEEGYDWLYRILKAEQHLKIVYSPDFIFQHPQVLLNKNSLEALNRVFNYRLGTAYLCRKHKFYAMILKRILLSTCASIVFFIFDPVKSRYYRTETMALILGWDFAKFSYES